MQTSVNLPLLDLLNCNPWRPPDAWWRRATGIVNDGDLGASVNRDSGRGCGWIKRAERFYDAFRQAGSHRQKMGALAEHPEIYRAHWIWVQEANDNRAIRWCIEARLLARQTNVQIARANACSASTIEAYESLFFNIRSRLDFPDYIFNSVLGQAAVHGVQARDHDLLWKLFGYLAGPYALDAMISHIPHPMWAQRPEDIPNFFQDAAINIMKKKATIAAVCAPVDQHTQMHLIDAFVKYVEIERSTDSAGDGQDPIQQGLQELLGSLPFAAIGVANEKQLPAIDRCGAEMRTDELLLTAVGMKPPGVDSLQQLRFPEHVSKS
jgi:hypothetical protein